MWHFFSTQRRILCAIEENGRLLRRILESLNPKETPTSVTFQEITLNPTAAGQTQVYTGALAPAGSAFPAGTTFTVTANDPAVEVSVDATGLVVTVIYPANWVESTTTPLEIAYSTSTFVPTPSTSPAVVTATITPSAPPVPVDTPTGVTFTQTS